MQGIVVQNLTPTTQPPSPLPLRNIRAEMALNLVFNARFVTHRLFTFGGRLPYSRKLELEADYIGLMLLAKTCHYNPEAAPAVFEALGRASGGHVEMLATHPTSDRRIQGMRLFVMTFLAMQGSVALLPCCASGGRAALGPRPPRMRGRRRATSRSIGFGASQKNVQTPTSSHWTSVVGWLGWKKLDERFRRNSLFCMRRVAAHLARDAVPRAPFHVFVLRMQFLQRVSSLNFIHLPCPGQPSTRPCRRRASQFSLGVVRGTLGRRPSRQTRPDAREEAGGT